MPVGDDLDQLLPLQVGLFVRTELRRPADLHGNPIYARYRRDTAEVFVELGLCEDAGGARMALSTAKSELQAEPENVMQVCSEGTEPSFLTFVGPRAGAFVAWTRGEFYFSAHAKDGEAALDAFMNRFPY